MKNVKVVIKDYNTYWLCNARVNFDKHSSLLASASCGKLIRKSTGKQSMRKYAIAVADSVLFCLLCLLFFLLFIDFFFFFFAFFRDPPLHNLLVPAAV